MALVWSLLLRESSPESETDVVPAFALMFAVWAIYLFDRLYDTRRMAIEVDTPERFRFGIQHRPLLIALALAAIMGALVCLPLLSPSLYLPIAFLSATTVLYYCLFRFFRSSTARTRLLYGLPWKESLIALSFAVAILLAAGFPLFNGKSLGLAFCLGVLFLSNCLGISRAEADFDRRHDPTGFYSEPGRQRIEALAALPLLAVPVGLISTFQSPGSFIGLAIVLTAALMHRLLRSKQIPSGLIQALSDLALILPPLALLLLRPLLVR